MRFTIVIPNDLKLNGYRYPISVISHAVWCYHRFNDSYRDISERLLARDIVVSHETVRTWCIRFAKYFVAVIKKSQRKPTDKWHLDEMYISMNGILYVLWRAVDGDSNLSLQWISGKVHYRIFVSNINKV